MLLPDSAEVSSIFFETGRISDLPRISSHCLGSRSLTSIAFH
jgi:hypothetical protein